MYTKISPFKNYRGTKKIRKITIHHTSGIASLELLGQVFSTPGRNGSANYGIDSDGNVGMFVPENYRAWTSSNATNDYQAITIEVSNDERGGNWHVSDKALASLIDLCVDICRRHKIERLNFTGDKSGNLTMHKMFANTDCPGPYLESKFPYIAKEVNRRLEKMEKLEKQVAELKEQVGVRWKYIDGNMPEWMKPTIKKLVASGSLQGSDNSYDVSLMLARILVILDREGVFKRGEWKINPDGYYPYCSECGYEPKNGETGNFCTECGARMKK